MLLATRNTGDVALPFGAGFHPWLARSPEMRLTMTTAGHWTETADHLPERFVPTASPFDFSDGAELPPGWINNAFTGWTGRAEVTWPDRGLALDIAARPPLTTVILYSPSSAASFVCFEPVSHSVDAHNRIDPGTAPPQVLGPGAVLEVEATFAPRGLR
jgi:aldose 1-epimerase